MTRYIEMFFFFAQIPKNKKQKNSQEIDYQWSSSTVHCQHRSLWEYKFFFCFFPTLLPLLHSSNPSTLLQTLYMYISQLQGLFTCTAPTSFHFLQALNEGPVCERDVVTKTINIHTVYWHIYTHTHTIVLSLICCLKQTDLLIIFVIWSCPVCC